MSRSTSTATRKISKLALVGLAAASLVFAAGCSVSGTKAAEKPAASKVDASPGLPKGNELDDSIVDETLPAADQANTPAPGTNQVPSTPRGSSDEGKKPVPQAAAPQPPAPTPVPTPSGPKPVIYSFNTPENIDCHNGNLQMFTASWTTDHADKVTISIDGPGVYDTYGPNGQTSLPFNCASSHTFLLRAYGNGQVVSKSITLQPRNVQVPTTDDDDEVPMP